MGRTDKKVKKVFTQKERLVMWSRLKSIINQPLYIDGLVSSMAGELHIDLMKLEKHIPNYNGEQCIYKGKSEYSIAMAIEEEWGKEATQLVRNLI